MLDGEEGMQSWRAALDTIELARIYDDRFTLRKAPITMSQILYISAAYITLVLADLYDQPDRRDEHEQAQAALDRLVVYLSQLSESWNAAAASLAALDTLRQEYAVKQAESETFDLTLDELLNLFLQPSELVT
ncbi:uncharacterized protein EHS24_002019 [Apiotrichum porosum]|uniref:Uncharacterized protein n=1 Tax=Apiotrichum porosum TaxID=105984 RepID=A0A427XK06_9TREE|nr:uncharacterized protein EHS24_002019 [Apiotrichum porosum]RSH79087.1 hypothetical protein EHS24_002019 [Apiotrichum porosum]